MEKRDEGFINLAMQVTKLGVEDYIYYYVQYLLYHDKNMGLKLRATERELRYSFIGMDDGEITNLQRKAEKSNRRLSEYKATVMKECPLNPQKEDLRRISETYKIPLRVIKRWIREYKRRIAEEPILTAKQIVLFNKKKLLEAYYSNLTGYPTIKKEGFCKTHNVSERGLILQIEEFLQDYENHAKRKRLSEDYELPLDILDQWAATFKIAV